MVAIKPEPNLDAQDLRNIKDVPGGLSSTIRPKFPHSVLIQGQTPAFQNPTPSPQWVSFIDAVVEHGVEFLHEFKGCSEPMVRWQDLTGVEKTKLCLEIRKHCWAKTSARLCRVGISVPAEDIFTSEGWEQNKHAKENARKIWPRVNIDKRKMEIVMNSIESFNTSHCEDPIRVFDESKTQASLGGNQMEWENSLQGSMREFSDLEGDEFEEQEELSGQSSPLLWTAFENYGLTRRDLTRTPSN